MDVRCSLRMLLCFSVQMTSQAVRLCGLLLREHFGEVVEKVGTHLLRGGAQNLRTIIHETGIPLDLVPLLLFLFQVVCSLLHTMETYLHIMLYML